MMTTLRHRLTRALVAVAACGLPLLHAQVASGQAAAIPSAHTPAPTGTVDHSAYDALLRAHVVDGLVDYPAFGRDPAFARYLASLDVVKPAALSPQERLAFWINAYNAFTIQLIVQHGETKTIRNIEKTLGVLRLKGPWSTPFVHAAGRTLTLDDIVHNILRKEFNEPRIHFALVYGAIGSPPLRSEAYRGETLDAQLDDQGRRFLRESPKRNYVEQSGRARFFVLSPIFTNFRSDFGSTRADLGRFLAHWFDPADKDRLERGAFMLAETPFDWALNTRRP